MFLEKHGSNLDKGLINRVLGHKVLFAVEVFSGQRSGSGYAFFMSDISLPNEYFPNNKGACSKMASSQKVILLNQIVKFCMVGGLNTGITLATIYMLFTFLKTSYITANGIGFLLGFVNSFFMNRLWTFKSNGKIIFESFHFILVFLFSYIVQLIGLVLLKDVCHLKIAVSQLLAMVFFSLVSFLGNKYVTFKRSE